MKKKNVSILGLAIVLLGLLSFNSCKDDEEDVPKTTDEQLFDMAKETTGFTWYKNSDALLDKSAGSGHSQPFLRTRYNAKASSQLDANGKIPTGASFPEGSLIVKELYKNSTSLEQYAILYKDSSNPNADAKGWVWGYLNADGSVVEPSANKGNACIMCHSQTGNIDYMLMNKYFP